eukprot:COSAG01_NODE_2535_length_7489_cov_14.116644_6_plen_156_part_00
MTDEAPWPGTVMPTPGDAGEASGSSPPLSYFCLAAPRLVPLAWHVLLCRRERQRRGGGSTPLRQYAATAYGNVGGGVAWQACVRPGRCTAVARWRGGGAVVQRRYRRHSGTGSAPLRGGAAAAAGGAPDNEGRAPGMVRVGVNGGGYVSPATACM